MLAHLLLLLAGSGLSLPALGAQSRHHSASTLMTAALRQGEVHPQGTPAAAAAGTGPADHAPAAAQQAGPGSGSGSAGANGTGTTPKVSALQETTTGQAQDKAAQTAMQKEKTGTEKVFGQLGSLSQEFAQIRDDDRLHVQKLRFHVELRDELRKKLREEVEKLLGDNELLTTQTGKVQEGILSGKSENNETAGGAGAGVPISLLSLNVNTSISDLVAGYLKQHAGDEEAGASTSAEAEMAKSALASLDALDQKISDVREKDGQEVAALRANSQDREALEEVIKKQESQLATDATNLDSSLDEIVGLAAVPTPTPPEPVSPVGGGCSTGNCAEVPVEQGSAQVLNMNAAPPAGPGMEETGDSLDA